MEPVLFESNHKKLGIVTLDELNLATQPWDKLKTFIRVLLLPAGYTLTIDFTQYHTTTPCLFFVNSNQYLAIEASEATPGYYLYYNRDFYCIQIHDVEVSCDGLLFNNIYNMPMVQLLQQDAVVMTALFEQMQEEMIAAASGQEEMLRTYLKQLIIRATRLWKAQQMRNMQAEPDNEVEFFRHFSRLVDIHFKEKHTVADYADLLGYAPKTLTHKLKRLHVSQPNEVIKDRIMLEAKRLLTYTTMSAKEIAYHLGYDDPAYFNRLFATKTGMTTSDFRKNHVSGKNVQLM